MAFNGPLSKGTLIIRIVKNIPIKKKAMDRPIPLNNNLIFSERGKV
jgi:hypothetical protein